MRDCISSLCTELMTPGLLPLLIPTSNNEMNMDTDCVRLNPHAIEPFNLKKFMFLGYFLGWSLRTMGGLGIDLPLAFWHRVCIGPSYMYTLEDLKSMDLYRFNELNQYIEAAELLSDEDFNATYDGYMFEGGIGYPLGDVELCEGGSSKPLRRENVKEYVQLYLKKYTEQENP